MTRPHIVGGDGLQVWESAALMRKFQPEKVGKV